MNKRKNSVRQRPLIEEFERRILYSADFGPALVASSLTEEPAEHRALDSFSDWVQSVSSVSAISQQELVFIDTAVAGYAQIAADISAQAQQGRAVEVVLVDAERDGLAQVSAALAGRQDLSAVHIIAHGTDGALQLGNARLDAGALDANSAQIASWGSALGTDGDLLLYGCDVAAAPHGRALLQTLSDLTGADVSASEDPTGAATLGGDWNLEFRTGNIESAIAVSLAGRADWGGLLAAGISVSSIDGNTTEAGVTATFTVTLDSQPTDDVTIGLSSSDASEGAAAPASLTFTSANWNLAQSVTVTGADDALDDGDIGYSVVTAAAVSLDANYSGLNAADVALTNTDNDTAGITVAPPTPLGGEVRVNTTTAGTQEVVSVARDAAGDYVVVWAGGSDIYAQRFDAAGVAQGIEFRINTNTSGTQDKPCVAMDDAGNFVVVWQDAEIMARVYNAAGVAVTGEFQVNTNAAGGNSNPAVAIDADGDFVVVWSSANQDGDQNGICAQRFNASGVAQGSEFQVNTYAQSNQNDPAVAMDAAGNFVVTWDSNAQDGSGSGIYAQRYDAAGAAQGSEFRVNTTTTGPQDSSSVAMADGGDFVVVWQSNDGSSDGIYAQRYNAGGLAQGTEFRVNTTITGGQTGSSVALDANGDFVVVWQSSGQDLAGTSGVYGQQYSAAGVTVGSEFRVNTTIVGDQATAASSNQRAGAVAMDSTGAFVIVWNGNGPGDTTGVFHQRYSDFKLYTTEAGGTDTFTVMLNSQPTANVTISLTSSDLTEGTVAPASLTFTPANWNVAQTVTMTGVNDAFNDGDIGYSIVSAAAVSLDANYSGLNAADVAVTNTDNDTPGISVSAISGNTTEAGGTATFTVTLNSQPTDDVTIGLASSDLTEGTLSTGSLTFTNANWNLAQTVTVAGVDDLLQDGDIGYSIVSAAAVSLDANYSGLNATNVAVNNTDNDTPGISVSMISGNTIEAGGTATFTVTLNSQPTDDVTIGLASSDLTEGTLSTGSLTFTSANWNLAQSVTVTGADDALDDGDIGYSVVTAAAVSLDVNYSGLNAADVALTNTDNDTAGISVSAISGNTTEAGGTATFTVVLNSQPTSDVTIGLSSSDASEGAAAPASLTFTGANWNLAQMVTVTGAQDFINDPDKVYTIVTHAATSADIDYDGLNATDISVANQEVANVAPVNTVPGAQDTNEESPLVFSTASGNPILIDDTDAGGNPVQVTLAVTNGVLTLTNTSGITFSSGDGGSDAVMTFAGPLSAVNAALTGLVFTPDVNFNGNAILTLTSADQGNTGSGGARSTTDTIAITVAAVNDSPVLTKNNLTLTQGGAVILTSANLAADDVDHPSSSLMFSVTNIRSGQFELVTDFGTALSTFTQGKLTSGQIRFVHDGSDQPPSYSIEVMDGSGSSGPGDVSVAFSKRADVIDTNPSTADGPVHRTEDSSQQHEAITPDTEQKTDPLRGSDARPTLVMGQNSEHAASNNGVGVAPPVFAATRDNLSASRVLPAVVRNRYEGATPAQENVEAILVSLNLSDLSLPASDSNAVSASRSGIALGERGEPADDEQDRLEILLDTLRVSGIAVSAGAVWWTSRQVGLLASLLASTPAWRNIDPLPVLARDDDEEVAWGKSEDEETERDESAIAGILQESAHANVKTDR